MNNDIVIRGENATNITQLLCTDILTSCKTDELLKWYSPQLVSLYISERDNADIDIQLIRGYKSVSNLDINISPDESYDKFSDRIIDTVRVGVKKYIQEVDSLDIKFEDNEYISAIRISRIIDLQKDAFTEPKYTIEIDTDKYDSLITQDHKLGGYPRISGKRILIKDIWQKNKQLDDYEGIRTIVSDLDNLVTEEEVKKAIEFAEQSDKFTEERINEEGSSDFVDIEDITDLDKTQNTVEDNR